MKSKIKPKMKRRDFLKFAAGAATLTAASSWQSSLAQQAKPAIQVGSANEFDYLIVGSGPGGAPLAVRLAQAGFSVGLIEAGSWVSSPLLEVPAYHVLASEWDPVIWRFYVKHYTNEYLNQKNPKYNLEKKGVFYPRGSTVGGSSAVNAMISMMPSRPELEELSKITGDSQLGYLSWQNTYDRISKTIGASDHQTKPSQYMETRLAQKSFGLSDRQFFEIIKSVFQDEQVPENFQGKIYQALLSDLNPNNKAQVQVPRLGPFLTPINSGSDGKRWGTKNLLLKALENPQVKSKLQVIDETFVTRLELQTSSEMADRKFQCRGVHVVQGKNLYSAGRGASPSSGKIGYFKAKKEVILSGGSFNSPQILQLSGIGDPSHLNKLGVSSLVPLPMVGRHLQDRYEVSVVSEMPSSFSSISQCQYNLAIDGLEKTDPCFQDFEISDLGSIYSTNGVIIGLKKKSFQSAKQPDLFIFANPGDFRGYEDGYSKKTVQPQKLSWVILKGYTENQSGSVAAVSKNCFVPPEINFRYFQDGTNQGRDFSALEMGIESVRKMNSRISASLGSPVREVYPAEKNLSDFIQYESWGHHASCSNKMGSKSVNPWDETAPSVVNSNFQVHGVQGLRIVDASVFPKIPGLFIGLPTFLLSEIAADKMISAVSIR